MHVTCNTGIQPFPIFLVSKHERVFEATANHNWPSIQNTLEMLSVQLPLNFVLMLVHPDLSPYTWIYRKLLCTASE